jgi:hypothetical protein
LLGHRAMRAGWLLALLASGCASVGEADYGEALTDLDGGAIGVAGGALWYRKVGCPSPDPSTCMHEASFWVDLRIRNDAYDKQVGLVWIDQVRESETDAWHVATARYEGTRSDGYETWGVDVSVRVINGIEPKPQIRFAAFVEMAGETSWDNHDGADHLLQ